MTPLLGMVPLAVGLGGSRPARAAIEDQRVPQAEPERPPPQLTRAPELLVQVQPAYPPELLVRGVGGEVVLAIDIDATGAVERAEVTHADHPGLGEAALVAATQLRFSPAEIDEVPSGIRIEYRMVFTPAEVEPDAIAGEPAGVARAEAPINFVGQVRQAGFREPVAGAVIHVDGRAAAETDEAGRFEVRGAPTGVPFTLRITSPYHRSYEDEEVIAGDERLEATYYLTRTAHDPFETVVRARTPPRVASRIQLDRRELQKMPGTFGDPIRVVENLPGLARAPLLGGALIVRGGTPLDTTVFIDGVPVPQLYHFGLFRSVLHDTMLDSIEFSPGGFSARYGTAIAGIVEIQTRELDCETWHGKANVALDEVNLASCLPLGEHWKVAAAGRRSYIDAVLAGVQALGQAVGEDPFRGVTLVPVYYDYQLKAEARYGSHALSVFLFGSDDAQRVIASGDGENPDFDVGLHLAFHRLLLRHRWSLTPELSLHSQVSPGFQHVRLVGASESAGLDVSAGIELWNVAAREELHWKLHDAFDLRIGFDGSFGHNAVALEVPLDTCLRCFPSPLFDPTETAEVAFAHPVFNHAYWAEVMWQPGFGLQITPGLRVDRWDFHKTQDLSVQPRLNVRWEFLEGMTAKAATGLYERLPDVQLLAQRPLGNPKLRPLQAVHAIVGYEHAFTDLIHLDVQAYYNRRLRIPASSQSQRVVDGRVIDEAYANSGGGETYGVEILLRHLAAAPGSGTGDGILDFLRGRFFGWISYTLSRAVYWDRPPGATFTRVPGDGPPVVEPYNLRSTTPYLSNFDQTHILTIVGQLMLPAGFELGLRYRLVSGNPFTPRDAGRQIYDGDTDSYVTDLSDVPRNSDRMPLFHQLDIRVDRTWTFDLWKFTAFLELINAYNAQNIEQIQFDYRARERTGLALLPILPILGVEGEW